MSLTVKLRIFLGFGLVLAVLAASSLSATVLVGRISRGETAMRNALAERDEALALARAAAESRVAVNRWLASPEEDHALRADRLIGEVFARLRTAGADPALSPGLVATVRRSADAFRNGWHDVRRLFGAEAGAFDRTLDPLADTIRAELQELRDTIDPTGAAPGARLLVGALESFNAAEAAASRFRVSDDGADADRVRDMMGDLGSGLDGVASGLKRDADTATLKDLRDRSGRWLALFGNIEQTSRQRLSQIGMTESLGDNLNMAVDALRTEAGAASATAEAALHANVGRARTVLFACTGLAILLGIAAATMVARSITRPLGRITAALNALAAGDASLEIPEQGRRDEIGRIAAAAEIFKNNAREVERLGEERAALAQSIDEEKRQAMRALADRFESTVGALVRSLSGEAAQLEATARSMSGSAEQAGRQAAMIGDATEVAGTSVQSAAGAANQLTSSICEISRQMSSSARANDEAGAEVARTVSLVGTLSDSAERIEQVVALVSSIARQTNLLALNATIEAARAGDAGKGFAVVAAEVKQLADRTADATGEIGTQIGQIQAASRDVATAIRMIAARIDAMSSISTAVAAAVEQQSAATSEIARNVQDTARVTDDVLSNAAAVRRATLETGRAANDVLVAANGFATETARLAEEVGAFVGEVRAA